MNARTCRSIGLGAGLSLVTRAALAQTAGHMVFTRAEIQAAGWQRINEILDAAPGWRVTSTDGFTFTPTADGLPAAGASGPGIPLPTIIVDGVRVPVSMLGQQELEFVPVVLAQLDSVVLTTEPRIVGSRIETRGTIEFFSHHPSRGATAQGEFQVGDVANKPGLYQYTPLRPENREHQGPFEHLLFGYGGTRAGVELGLRYATLNTTDSLILARQHRGVTAGTVQINLPAPTAHVVVDAFGGHHSFDATRTHYSGLFFVPAYGHEQALRMYATSITAGGNAMLPATTELVYSAGYTADDVTPLPSPTPSTLRHRRKNLTASADLSRAVRGARATLGAAVDRWSIDEPVNRLVFQTIGTVVNPFPVARTDVRSSARLDAPAIGRWTNGVALTAIHTNGTTQLGGLLASRLAAGEHGVFALTLASTSEAATQNGTWIDPAILGAGVPDAVRRTRVADASWTYSLPHGAALLTGARVSSVSGWPIALPSDTGNFELTGEPPPNPIPSALQIAAARIGLESRYANRLYGRVLYSYSGSIGGDALAQTAARSIARHQLNGIAWFVPGGGWRVGTVLQAVSGTYWSAFPSIQNGYLPNVPGFTRVDLSAEKLMWRRHVRFQYLVRDILNDSERWQPRSAQFNLRWMVAAAFVVGTRD